MTLAALADLAEMIAAFGVIAGLVFVAALESLMPELETPAAKRGAQ